MHVAVIIPCHNVAHYVEAALRSALDQEGVEVELIAVDDGSTDGTLGRLRELESAHPGKVRVAALDKQGAAAARNHGLQRTAAPMVRFLDADDALLPGALQRQVALMERSGADVVVGAYLKRFPDGRPDELDTPWTGESWEGLVRTRLGTTSANLFRREAVLDAGGWDNDLRSSQDYELLFRMLKRGARIAVDETPSAIVLKRERGSISRTDEQANWLRYIELRRAIRDHLKALDHTGHAAIIATADQYLFMAIRVLSAHDRTAAFAAFDRIMPEGFIPEPSRATRSMYICLYRLLGFRWAERLAGVKDAMMGR